MKIGSAKTSNDHSRVVPVTLTCACNRDVTTEEMMAIFSTKKKEKIETFLPLVNQMFKDYGMNSCLRKAHFIAQVGCESARFNYLEEQDISEEKEKISYQGYKGRGLLQLTYPDPYQEYGKVKGEDFMGDNRTKLLEPKWAVDSAGWFWTSYKKISGNLINLNDYADNNDFIFITQTINGAFNGWDDRINLLKRAFKYLLVPQCPNQQNCFRADDFFLLNSFSNKMAIVTFAWGYWFDPASPSKKVLHVTRDTKKAKDGYSRFLEIGSDKLPIFDNHKKRVKDGRFGFIYWEDLLNHAKKRLTELTKDKGLNNAAN